MFELLYHPLVKKEDWPKIDVASRTRIERAIRERLTRAPQLYGLPLRQTLAGYRKLRVGDYRVIYRIEKFKVKIFIIGQRKDVYQKATRRLA